MHSQREGVSSFTFEFTHLEPLETVSLADFATSLRPFSHHDRPGFSPWDVAGERSDVPSCGNALTLIIVSGSETAEMLANNLSMTDRAGGPGIT